MDSEPTLQSRPRNKSPQQRVTSACAECRRRRIKCEGSSAPCRQCRYYQVPHLCHFPLRKTRSGVSWRAHADLTESFEKSRKILSLLLPSQSMDELTSMTREQLLEKVLASHSQLEEMSATATQEPDDDNFRILEPSPERIFAWDEVSDQDDTETSRIADNVNGLEFWGDMRESYLGLPSVPTILRVIAHLVPQIRQHAPPNPQVSPDTAPPTKPITSVKVDEMALINAYFFRVHPITPMIDEADFRQRYAQGISSDNPSGSWMVLLYMVLAMGCLASDATSFDAHNTYYKRATQCLNLSCLGSGNLYTVQALGLYGGYLLHFLHKPNMANAIMGASIRMAIGMGMHRVRLRYGSPAADQDSVITRIRTWWSLFCLDTWAATTLGRPNMGYWDPATILTSPASLMGSTDYSNIALAANQEFCKIATRIQHRLIHPPLMNKSEINLFDGDLIEWKDSLHIFLSNRDSCPPNLRAARGWLWSRFMTTRLTLYRPCLLQAAIIRPSLRAQTGYDQVLVTKSIQVATDTVDILSLDWFSNQLTSWNTAWHLFQAALVLILALAVDEEWAIKNSCNEYVYKALDLFSRVEHDSPGGCYSREILRHLHQVVNGHGPDITNQNHSDVASTLTLDLLDVDLMGQDSDWLECLYGDDHGFDEGSTSPWRSVSES